MEKLRVATHNVCHMGFNPLNGSELLPDLTHRFGYEADKVEMMKKNWDAVYSAFSADIIAFQEYCPWFDFAHTIPTREALFERFGYLVDEGEWVSNMRLTIASKMPLEKGYERSFMPASERRRRKAYVTVGDKRIAIFNCHPTPGNNQEVRQREYALLLENFKDEEYFIACGDYNARTMDEFEIFKKAGYSMANTGIGTVRKTGLTCDNIIVSQNIRIEKTELFDKEFSLSDHAILYAEVLIL